MLKAQKAERAAEEAMKPEGAVTAGSARMPAPTVVPVLQPCKRHGQWPSVQDAGDLIRCPGMGTRLTLAPPRPTPCPARASVFLGGGC